MGLVNAAARAAAGEDGDRRKRLHRDHSTPAGLEALLDVPRGLDDALEPLLRAAALAHMSRRSSRKALHQQEAFEVYKSLASFINQVEARDGRPQARAAMDRRSESVWVSTRCDLYAHLDVVEKRS